MSLIRRKRLGDMLVEVGLLTEVQLTEALQIQRETGKRLGEVLTDHKYVSESQIIKALEQQLRIPYLQLDKYYIDPMVPTLISEILAKKYELVPVKKENSKLTVAMWDPMNIVAIDDVQMATGLIVEPAIASRADVLKAIGLYYGKQHAERAIEDFAKENEQDSGITESDEDLANLQNAPVVRLVNTIITQAVRSEASDVHIEPFEDEVIVRMRIDGNLQQVLTPAKSMHPAIVARIKIMARLDIAEKRVAQDGRIETVIENTKIDMRISVLPTMFGEKIVIRMLYRNTSLVSKEKLGFSDYNLETFNKIIKSPIGMVIITGPTGSGKSTTLYTVLEELKSVTKNIVTVEDPVEYIIGGISQVQVSAKAGMTFSTSLSAILRQDPDIIMIGEMRDAETCSIAIRASITGHLVFSTLHTNDTASTVTRLIDMGVEPYMVATSVVGIVAQRLVRRICTVCKTEHSPSDEELQLISGSGINFSNAKFYKGQGCASCRNTGYKGRIALHEVLPVTKEIRAMIVRLCSADEIKDEAIRNGMYTLKQSCFGLVTKGVTTIEEMIRVTYSFE